MAKPRRATTSRPRKKPAEPKQTTAAKQRAAAADVAPKATKKKAKPAPATADLNAEDAPAPILAVATPEPPTEPDPEPADASDVDWTEIASLLTPRTRDRLQRAFALEDEAFSHHSPHSEPETSSPLVGFDPFDSAAPADEPPFDAPSDEPIVLETPDGPDIVVADEEPLSLDTPSPPPLEPIRPMRDAPAQTVAKPLYLERARRAAQERAQAIEHVSLADKLRHESRLVLSVAVGLAAPLLIFAGALALRGPTPPEQTQLAPAQASAAEASTSGERDYAVAINRLSEGRAREGVMLLRRAAEAGFTLAQYRLAKLYESGDGLPRDVAAARAWTERAAEGGNCRAMHDLGVHFARGEGAPLDAAAAFRWFRQAAAFGVADSQFNLGVLYQQGRGVAADQQEALFWYLLAARQGDADATDRAVDLASGLAPDQVARVRARARAFQPAPPDPAANGDAACRSV